MVLFSPNREDRMGAAGDAALTPSVRALWGLAEPGRRGPKRALSVEEIAGAAVELADAEGLAAVTMAAVAKRLGNTAMSLYRYVGSRQELLEVMVEVASGPPPPLAPRRGWRRQLTDWVRADLARVAAHPWILDVQVAAPPLGPNMLGWTDRGMSILLDAGLPPRQAASSLLTLDGFARQQVALRRQFSDPEAVDRWADAVRAVVDPERFPGLSTVLESGALEDGDPPGDPPDGEEFEFGLALLLDGIERLVRH
jgi:AcrR family transcriptional regulator